MSRIGRLPVVVPAGVDIAIDGQAVTVKGPKGQLALVVAEPIAVAKGESGAVEVTRPDDERLSRSSLQILGICAQLEKIVVCPLTKTQQQPSLVVTS